MRHDAVEESHSILPPGPDPPHRVGRRPVGPSEHPRLVDHWDWAGLILDRHEGCTVFAAGMPAVSGLVRPLSDPYRDSFPYPSYAIPSGRGLLTCVSLPRGRQ